MSLSVIYLLHCIARRFIGTALAVSLSLRHTFRVIVLFASIRPGRPKPLRLKGQLPLQQIFIDIGILTLQRQLPLRQQSPSSAARSSPSAADGPISHSAGEFPVRPASTACPIKTLARRCSSSKRLGIGMRCIGTLVNCCRRWI